MPRRTLYKAFAILMAILTFAPTTAWLYVKFTVSRTTMPYHSVWSDTGACRIDAYIPNYASLGVPGRLIQLFSSEAFFRVYRKDGALLKSSEWLLWQREFAEDEAAKWIYGHAIYPTGDGYRGWTLPECG